MKLPFNPIRLIVVCLSTLLIVGSVSWYAKSMRNRVRKSQRSQKQMEQEISSKPSLPEVTAGSEPTQPVEAQQPFTIPSINPSIQPATVAPASEPPGFSEDLRSALLPRNPVLGPLKGIQEKLWFRLELEDSIRFDKGKVPTVLRKAFKSHGIPLSRGATVSMIEPGKKWLITDKVKNKKRTYTVRKNEKSLTISEEGVKYPERFSKPEDWQTFNLEESRELIRRYLEEPNRYYGAFDLQEDLSQWSSPPGYQPDWTTMPWEELRKRYILRYPDRAKPLMLKGDRFTQKLSPEYRAVLNRTRYRLVTL
ncbi:MAG: hypothetical protein O7E52_01720, partial [Candidatus Poribacteria bacterium]|nr:hypothetical protein [Candidatus Poribacteria bacterium]